MKFIKRLSNVLAVSVLFTVGFYALPVGATGSWVSLSSTEAFQANNGYLYTNVTGGSALNTVQGMAAGTSPAIVNLKGGGYEVAFQANNGYLYLFNTKTGKAVNTLQGMAAGTSPAIAAYPYTTGGYEVAFHANNGYVYTYNWSTGPSATTLAMTTSSNPSIAIDTDGNSPGNYTKYDVAYSAAGSNDLTFDYAGAVFGTNQGIAPGTSPSISPEGTADVAAYVANGTNRLDLYWSGTGAAGTGISVEPNTSPSITATPSNIYEVAFAVPGTDNLGILSGVGPGTILTNQGLVPGTSPSITGSGSEYQVAFQAAGSDHLIVYEPANNAGIDTDQGMATSTSPGIN